MTTTINTAKTEKSDFRKMLDGEITISELYKRFVQEKLDNDKIDEIISYSVYLDALSEVNGK